jgi:hypothetical protein
MTTTEPSLDPAEAEATGEETVEVTFEGHTYTIPASVDDVDIEVIRAFERNAGMAIVDGLLGQDQMALLERRHRSRHAGKFTSSAMKPLIDDIARALGFTDPGE